MLCERCERDKPDVKVIEDKYICLDCQNTLLEVVGLKKIGEAADIVILEDKSFRFPKFGGQLRHVYETICQNQGCSLTELSRYSEINTAQITYYTRALEDLGVLYFEQGTGTRKRVTIIGVVNSK